MERGVAGDAGVVDQHLDRPELGFDAADRRLAGLEVAHVESVDRDAGLVLEAVRRLVVAAVIRRDLEPGAFARRRDRRADPAGTAGTERPACDYFSPSTYRFSGLRRFYPVTLKPRQQKT